MQSTPSRERGGILCHFAAFFFLDSYAYTFWSFSNIAIVMWTYANSVMSPLKIPNKLSISAATILSSSATCPVTSTYAYSKA